jgi:UTP---glucose-1-phosphate uridylyltransferase
MVNSDWQPTSLQQQIQVLESLCQRLQKAKTIQQKVLVADEQPQVRVFLRTSPSLAAYLNTVSPEAAFVIKIILAIGQGEIIFDPLINIEKSSDCLQELVQTLLKIEKFYTAIGGIAGYHLTVLKFILEKEAPHTPLSESVRYFTPEGIDISKPTPEVHQMIRWGIEQLEKMAEIYPVGGAGDRLQLLDEKTGEPLPAAQLPFCGRTLIEGLIRDLQGREYLHYKLCGKQLITPIAIMTSHEKHNHEHICQICEDHQWFGRPRESFLFFIQLLVPVITKEGKWVMSSPLHLALKPGGHGVIWKEALDQGVFDWLKQQNRTKALIRQINNPIAGTDNGLIAFAGLGSKRNKDFGFASCFRLLNTAEGMDVLIERKIDDGFEYRITNIEYTEFEQRGVKDAPSSPDSPYSLFPANTNILFIDLEAIKDAVAICPIPGMLINMKNTVSCSDSHGQEIQVQAGRLESTMQNIADYIVEKHPFPLEEGKRGDLRTYLTYNQRNKTISVTKQIFVPGKPLVGTPEGCFYDLMSNYHDLLTNYCMLELPDLPDEMSYLQQGPSFLVHIHPALGMLYSVIAQKIRGGSLAFGSEWILEIAEVDIENLQLEGSLIVEADSVMGKSNEEGIVVYSSNCGKCVLKNVVVKNQGIDRNSHNHFWKNQINRKECLHIVLHGNAEFTAENVVLSGDYFIEVPEGEHMKAYLQGDEVLFRTEKIDSPTWQWNYSFDKKDRIVLRK